MALTKARRIEEILRQAQMDPRLTAIIVELAERQRVQHQQIYAMAQLIVKFQDLLSQLIVKMGVRDDTLKKLGVEEMIKNMQDQKSGNLVESVEEFDKGTSDQMAVPGRKN